MAQPLPDSPTSVLARPLLPASIAIFVTVALAAFEGLAVAAALPEIAADLGDVSLLPWVITSFLLTSGVATVVSGRLIDNVGVKLMFRIAVIVFTIAGVLALTLIIAAPILRVLLLAVVWWTEQDRTFVLLAIVLLSVIATGAVIAYIT